MNPTYNADLQFYQFEDRLDFTPVYSPDEMIEAGVFGGNYFGNLEVQKNWKDFVPPAFVKDCNVEKLIVPAYVKSINRYGVDCGMDYPGWLAAGWIVEQDPYGWFNWYINFYYGRRSADDNRQISRWKSFIGRHSGMLKSMCSKKGVSISDESIGRKTRQGLLHWAYSI